MALHLRPSRLLSGFLVLVSMAAPVSSAVAAKGFPLGSYDSEGYSVTFMKSGAFRYTKGAQLLVDGEFVVKGSEISLTDKSGVDACVGPDRNPGRYRWTQRGDSLSFTTIHDSCAERIRGITRQQWRRKAA